MANCFFGPVQVGATLFFRGVLCDATYAIQQPIHDKTKGGFPMARYSKFRWSFIVLCALGLISMIYATEKVQPTPGAIQLGNFDTSSTKIQPYNDAGAGKHSKSKTEISKDAIEGENALKYSFKLDGWCGIALARQNAKKVEWDWSSFSSFGLWFKGQNSGVKFGIDLQDKSDERLTAYFTDDSTEWKKIIIPLSDFQYREDYQDPAASVNGVIDYPLKAFAIYPITPNGSAEVIFDSFEILPKQ